MSMTSSDIIDIRNRFKKIISQIKVNVSNPEPVKGSSINPGEHFTVKIEALNPWQLGFKNVRWQVRIVSPDPSVPMACLIVPVPPPIARWTIDGPVIKPGKCVNKLILYFPDDSPPTYLPPEGKIEIQVEGIANELIDTSVEGTIEAKIYCDADLNYLFAFGAASTPGDHNLEIIP